MSLLKQNNINNEKINKLLELEPEFVVGEDKKYKVEVIKNNAIYTNKIIGGQ